MNSTTNRNPSALEPTSAQATSGRPDVLQPASGSSIQPVFIDNASDSDDKSEFPMPTTNAARTSAVQQAAMELPSDFDSPSQQSSFYGVDTEDNPRWLKGKLEVDTAKKIWSIMYDVKPDPRDAFGGVITLSSHPELKLCHDGDMIVVHGAIDEVKKDKRGMPIYTVSEVSVVAESGKNR